MKPTEFREVLVFDTGPLSHFARHNWLGVLKAVVGDRTAVIPDVVVDELRTGAARGSRVQAALDANWIEHRELRTAEEILAFAGFSEFLVRKDRNRGEAGVLALACVTGGVAVVDDGAARRAATRHGIALRPTLSLLCEAIQLELLTVKLDSERTYLAGQIQVLAGFLAFGSPTTVEASRAAALARQLYAGLSLGDHRIDIAASWSAEALFHHEVSFNPANPDPLAEQALQRTAAAESAAILTPMVEPARDPTLTTADLLRVARILDSLIGLSTFGAPDSAPSVRAAEVGRRVYAWLTAEDHRLDIGANWAALAMRHHEVSFHPANTDPSGEQAKQRAAAAESAAILIPLAETLPDPAFTDLQHLAGTLDRLVGLLTFGAPPDDPRTGELQRLSASAAAMRDKITRLLGG